MGQPIFSNAAVLEHVHGLPRRAQLTDASDFHHAIPLPVLTQQAVRGACISQVLMQASGKRTGIDPTRDMTATGAAPESPG